jgi:hypothetical protein
MKAGTDRPNYKSMTIVKPIFLFDLYAMCRMHIELVFNLHYDDLVKNLHNVCIMIATGHNLNILITN